MRICLLQMVLIVAAMSAALLPLAAEPTPGVEPEPVTLVYAPTADQVDARSLRVEITQLLLADAPTGMTGSATADSKLTATAVTVDGSTLRMEIANLRQQMAGHALPSTSPEPAILSVDRRARLTEPPVQETQAAGEILSQGGLPVQALVVICGLPQLPDKPVLPGDTWQRTDTYDLPGLGQAKLEISTTFEGLKDGVATLRSTIRIRVPDFEADNPLLPGQKVKVHNLIVDATDLVQQYEVARSTVQEARGILRASLEATAPDLTLPLKLVATVTYQAP